jgi:rhodanese-related sulfurtransferase
MFIDTENNKHITNQELMNLRAISNPIILDIRELFEYHICHIPDSLHIPMNHLLLHYEQLLQKNKEYYIICHTGRRSYYVTDYLSKLGYSIINVIGGIAQNDQHNVPY